jgi:eukaryotic-like serine/threonine-protein kinase
MRAAGLTPVPKSTASTTISSGVVLAQAPPFGRVVRKGTRVELVVSSGPPTAPLANVAGLTQAKAVSTLRAAGFKTTGTTKPSASVEEGLVIATEPVAGTRLPVGSPVAVVVSSGPAPVRVPDTVGQARAGAEAAIETVGLTVGAITQQVSAAQAPGTVLSQSPAAGSSLRAGGKVNLTVAQAPTSVAVPSVVGQNEAEAAAALGRAGFTPKAQNTTTTQPTQVGIVLNQSPAAGTRANKGATVTIRIGVLGTPTGPTTPTTTTPTTPTTTTPTTPAAAPAG